MQIQSNVETFVMATLATNMGNRTPSARQEAASLLFGRPFVHGVAVIAVAIAAQCAMLMASRQYQAEALISISDQMKRQKLYSVGFNAALQSVSLYPFTGYGHYFAADNAALLARPKEAARLLDEAEPWMPHLPQLLRFRGQLLHQQRDYARAATALSRYFTMDPQPRSSAEQFIFLLAQSLYRSIQPAHAATVLNRAENTAEYASSSLYARAINAVMLRQPAIALALLRRCRLLADGTDPVDPKELFSSAAAAQRLDTMAQVVEQYRREATVSPAMTKVLALSLVKAGRAQDGLMLLQLLAGQMPEDPEVWLLLGDISIEMERRDWAASFYKEHLRRAPDSPFANEIQAKLGTPP